MMEAARTSETSVDNYFTRQYIPEDNSELQSLLGFHKLNGRCEISGSQGDEYEDVSLLGYSAV
jgi:hypothetical protein